MICWGIPLLQLLITSTEEPYAEIFAYPKVVLQWWTMWLKSMSTGALWSSLFFNRSCSSWKIHHELYFFFFFQKLQQQFQSPAWLSYLQSGLQVRACPPLFSACCLAAYAPSPLVYPPPLGLTGHFESFAPSTTPTQDTLRTQNQHNTKHMSHRQVLERGVGEKTKQIYRSCHTNRSHTWSRKKPNKQQHGVGDETEHDHKWEPAVSFYRVPSTLLSVNRHRDLVKCLIYTMRASTEVK